MLIITVVQFKHKNKIHELSNNPSSFDGFQKLHLPDHRTRRGICYYAFNSITDRPSYILQGHKLERLIISLRISLLHSRWSVNSDWEFILVKKSTKQNISKRWTTTVTGLRMALGIFIVCFRKLMTQVVNILPFQSKINVLKCWKLFWKKLIFDFKNCQNPRRNPEISVKATHS